MNIFVIASAGSYSEITDTIIFDFFSREKSYISLYYFITDSTLIFRNKCYPHQIGSIITPCDKNHSANKRNIKSGPLLDILN